MSSTRLENLARTGELKWEPPDPKELAGLLSAARAQLADAQRVDLSPEGRFTCVYAAAHAACRAALRWHGYRTDKRYLVFQLLPETLGVGPETWRVLSKAHEQRNLSEYSGDFEVDDVLFRDVLAAADKVLRLVAALPSRQ